MRRSLLPYTLTLLTALAPLAAHADDAAQARFFDELAREHYAKKRYRQALEAFFEEHRLAPNPRIVFNIGLCFERLGDPARAYAYYEEYLASGEVSEERRAYAEEAKARLSSRVARVQVRTEPPGAEIFVDEREHGSYGRSPREIVVIPGAHRIQVELPGHRLASETVEVGRGAGAEVALTLSPILGTLAVTADPPAEIQVRDEDGRTLESGKSPFEARLPVGVYVVAATAPDRQGAQTLLRVEADARTEHRFVLAPTVRAKGEVVFTSNVRGALVEVDGEPIGFAPVVGELDEGAHELKISHPERLPYVAPFEVRPAQRAWLTAQLEPPPRTERSSLTWVSGGLGLAFLAAGGVVGVLANQRHADFEAAQAAGADDALELRADGRTLNTTADALMITGAISVVTSVVLFFVTEREIVTESSGSVSWEAR